ncbi:MliC family protein [Microbulbifer celer]|uniref:MliC family protein n=1 Tax=Microbulbifer celer TaxID=435905 RepID=A0ABW3U7V6_9GAMM|nr:MliC family protein [Microbulbifer celer]UFN58689.1 MliC family protein [Microbulbifer celer]
MMKQVVSSVIFAVGVLAGCGASEDSEQNNIEANTPNLTSETPRTQTALGEAATPALDCSKPDDSIEEMVCADSELAMLDRKLELVYQTALMSPKGKGDSWLKASQIGWVKARAECRAATDKRPCVLNSYQRRIAELQALYSLVPGNGPVVYRCSEGDVTATYYQTDPPSAVVEYGGKQSLMFLQPSGSGARYEGRNESLWEHQGEASVIWGHGAAEMRCKIN